LLTLALSGHLPPFWPPTSRPMSSALHGGMAWRYLTSMASRPTLPVTVQGSKTCFLTPRSQGFFSQNCFPPGFALSRTCRRWLTRRGGIRWCRRVGRTPLYHIQVEAEMRLTVATGVPAAAVAAIAPVAAAGTPTSPKITAVATTATATRTAATVTAAPIAAGEVATLKLAMARTPRPARWPCLSQIVVAAAATAASASTAATTTDLCSSRLPQ